MTAYRFLILCMSLLLPFLAQSQVSEDITLHFNWDIDTIPATPNGREYNDIWGYTDCEGREFGIMGSASAVHFFNVSNPDSVYEIAFFPGGELTTWRDMKTFKDHAYAVSDNTSEGLMIFDLSGLPDTVIKTNQTTADFARAHNIYIDEGRLYVAGSNTQSSGLIIYDLAANPDTPQLMASVNLPGGGYVHDVYVRNKIAYCSHGYNGFYAWDLSNPATPVLLASVNTLQYNHSSWVSTDGSFAVFAEEVPTGQPLGIIDLTDIDNGNIEEIYTFKYPLLAPGFVNNTPHNPFIRGDYLICSYYEDGLQVFDLSDSVNVDRVAYYDTHPTNTQYNGYFGNWGTYPFFPSSTILASDMNNGMFVLSLDSLTLDSIPPPDFPTISIDSDNPDNLLCGKDTLILLAEPGAEFYTWYKDGSYFAGGGSPSVMVTQGGDYYVVASNGPCETTSSTLSVIGVPLPDFNQFNQSELTLCEGEIYPLQAPTADSYTWFNNGDTLSEQSNLLIIEDPGVYNVEIDITGCVFSSIDITVNVIDAPVFTGLIDSLFCPGGLDSATISFDSIPGFEPFLWYKNGVPFLANSLTLTTTDTGSYSLSVNDSLCSFFSDPVNIQEALLPVPTIQASDSFFCPGDNVAIWVNNGPFSAYSWLLDGQPASLPPTDSISVSEAGTYTVYVENMEGCVGEEDISVSTYPVVNAFLNVTGNTITTIPALSYQWHLDGAPIPGAINQSFEVLTTGDYHVIIVDNNGCIWSSDTLSIIISGLNTAPKHTGISVWPNPGSDIVWVSLEQNQSWKDIRVLSTTGQTVLYKTLASEGSGSKWALATSTIPAGVYVILVQDSSGQSWRKVWIKQ